MFPMGTTLEAMNWTQIFEVAGVIVAVALVPMVPAISYFASSATGYLAVSITDRALSSIRQRERTHGG